MRSILYYILLTIAVFSTSARTVQYGVVKEYKEKNQKTPLSGVEIRVRYANSTVSDKDGKFSLNFLTMNPGDKVNVRERGIEKNGYEVFNKEAVDQWNINPGSPFVIVMCRSDRFKKIRDNYERVASENYARQLEKEESELVRLKNQGKLKDAEYQKLLKELVENHQRQLDDLDTYIDRFSRIDLSELNSVEQEIIELVQNGDIEAAIARYDEQDYLGKYTRVVEQLREVSRGVTKLTAIQEKKKNSRDSLLSAIDRHIGTLRLAGGRENFSKINMMLRTLADSDTLNYELQFKAGDHLKEQKYYEDALVYLKRCEKSDSTFLRAQALFGMSIIYYISENNKDYDRAYAMADSCLSLFNDFDINIQLLILSHISLMNALNEQPDKTLNQKLVSSMKKIEGNDFFSNIVKAHICYVIVTSGLINDEMSVEDKFNYINYGLSYARTAYEQTETQIECEMAEYMLLSCETINMMLLLEAGQEFPEDDVSGVYIASESKFNHNPRKYEDLYLFASQLYLKWLAKNDESSVKKQFETIYKSWREQGIKDSRILYGVDGLTSYFFKIEKYLLSIEIFNSMNDNFRLDMNDMETSNLYAYILFKFSATYLNIGDEASMTDYLKQSVSLYSKLEDIQMLSPVSKTVWYPQALSYLGEYYMSVKKYDMALPLFTKAIRYYEKSETDMSLFFLLGNFWYCSVCHLKSGDMDMANHYLNKIIELEGRLEDERVNQIFADTYCNLSWNEYEKENYDKALFLVNKGLEYKPDYVPLLDNKGLYLFKMGKLEEAQEIMSKIEAIADLDTVRNTDLYKALIRQ